jgi:hypothetical protein
MYTIHLINFCSGNDYQPKIIVNGFTDVKKCFAIKVKYNDKILIIPLSNITMIEEHDDA